MQWDWKAATTHLLTEQYPLALAACKEYYGDKFMVPRLPAPEVPVTTGAAVPVGSSA